MVERQELEMSNSTEESDSCQPQSLDKTDEDTVESTGLSALSSVENTGLSDSADVQSKGSSDSCSVEAPVMSGAVVSIEEDPERKPEDTEVKTLAEVEGDQYIECEPDDQISASSEQSMQELCVQDVEMLSTTNCHQSSDESDMLNAGDATVSEESLVHYDQCGPKVSDGQISEQSTQELCVEDSVDAETLSTTNCHQSSEESDMLNTGDATVSEEPLTHYDQCGLKVSDSQISEQSTQEVCAEDSVDAEMLSTTNCHQFRDESDMPNAGPEEPLIHYDHFEPPVADGQTSASSEQSVQEVCAEDSVDAEMLLTTKCRQSSDESDTPNTGDVTISEEPLTHEMVCDVTLAEDQTAAAVGEHLVSSDGHLGGHLGGLLSCTECGSSGL